MDLLSKFDAVIIQADSRITENDRDYCIAHQKAYDVARSCFHELVYIWEDLTTQQSDILTDKEQESYGRNAYLPSNDDLKISTDKIEDHIKSLHTRLIRRLVQHFNQRETFRSLALFKRKESGIRRANAFSPPQLPGHSERDICSVEWAGFSRTSSL